MANFLAVLISTFFYAGYLPLIPGTFASVFGIAVFYLIKDSAAAYFLVTLIILILGFLSSGRAERVLGKKDDRRIVIDEVCGMLLALAFLPYDIRLVTLAFILFRILDTMKPFPAARMQGLKGSPGIMSDDLIAGIYANIILQVVLRLATLTGS